MQISEFIWDEENLNHVAQHGVHPEEVEEACWNQPFILKGRNGSYLIFSQTNDGRYLLVVARYMSKELIRTITARDMTNRERKFCQSKRR